MLSSPHRRMALREINTRTPQSVARNLHTVTTPQNNVEIPSSILTPSPEEQVIKQRGRKKYTQGTLLQSWAGFGLEDTPPKTPHTPTKSPRKSPAKNSSTPVRTSPRKRIISSPIPMTPSPSKGKKNLSFSLPAKRRRISNVKTPSSVQNVLKSLKTLTQDQLIDVFHKTLSNHPDLIEEIGEFLPQPDLKPIEDKLEYLRKNIFKSFPWTKYGSSRDAFCYRRVSTHLMAFKKECVEQGRIFSANEQWSTLLEYVYLAWSFVEKMPDWDNPTHNKTKEQCFKTLSQYCLKALKQGHFETVDYADAKERLEEMKCDSAEIEASYNFARMKAGN